METHRSEFMTKNCDWDDETDDIYDREREANHKRSTVIDPNNKQRSRNNQLPPLYEKRRRPAQDELEVSPTKTSVGSVASDTTQLQTIIIILHNGSDVKPTGMISGSTINASAFLVWSPKSVKCSCPDQRTLPRSDQVFWLNYTFLSETTLKAK